MKTKAVPAIVMLSGGFIACIIGMINHLDAVAYTKMLLIVLVIFYILGCIIKVILDKNFPEMQEEENEEELEDGENLESEKENIESEEVKDKDKE